MIICNNYPIFERGKILDSKMLDSLRNLNLDYIKILYSHMNDGIIHGINPFIKENKIYIQPGIIKFQKEYCLITDAFEVKIPLEDGEYIYSLEKLEKKKIGKYIEVNYFFEILKDTEPKGLEIFRIKRREGANLKNPEKFIGLDKEYNTLNTINLKKISDTGIILDLNLLKLYSVELLKNKILTNLDRMVCLIFLNKNIERDLLKEYLNLKENFSNKDIYKALELKFNSLNTKKYDIEKTEELKSRKMMVD